MTIAIIVFIAAAVVFAFSANRSAGTINDPHAPKVPVNDDGILLLIRQQKLIEAIKVYRELHDVGLKEAKDAVEALAAGGKPAGAAPPSDANPVEDADVVSMIRQGNIEDAIRMYRELHGTDLKSAKDAVDALAKTVLP